MQFLQLTHAEAADAAVMANIAAHLTMAPTPRIAPADRPDVGADPLPVPAARSTAVAAAPTIAPAAVTLPTPSVSPVPALPPAPAVPVVVASAAAPESPAVDVDKNGLPWDGRIHSSTKTKNVDGTWRQKRGTDPAEVAEVEAELRQVMGLPPLPEATPALPALPVPPVSSVFALGAQAAAPTTIPELMMWLGGKMPAVFNQAELAQELGAIQPGLTLPLVLQRPDLVPTIHLVLSAKYGA